MQLEAQDFIRLVENARTMVFFDTESNGLHGDFGTLLCGSIKTVNGPTITHRVEKLGNDRVLARAIKDSLEAADCWVTYYGKGHDIPLLNTRLLRWGIHPVDPRPHIDLYYTLKPKLRTSRKSQGHILRFLGTLQQKMDVAPQIWGELAANFETGMTTITERCESDVAGLEALFHRCKHLVRDIKR